MLDSASPWRRDLVALLRLTGPVAAARLGVMAMGLIDAIVVGRYSAVQLGYQALGWTLPAVAMVGSMGFLSGVQLMTARYLGQGRPDLTGGVFRRGLAYALVLGVGMGALLFVLGPAVMHAFRLAPGLADGATAPLRVFAASLPSVLIAFCAGMFLEATGKAGVSMALMWTANLVNLGIDLVLVPGAFGLPALGAVGSAWATFGARTFLAAALFAYILRMKTARSLGLFDRASDGPAAAAEQRRLGYGAGVSQLVESAAFSGMNLVVGAVSALAVAGWAVVLNFTAIVFMTPMGISVACAVLVARSYGARDEAGVRRAAVLGFGVAAAYGLVAASVAVFLRGAIAAAYTSDPALFAAASAAVGLAALFLCPDAIQVVAAQALRARGDVLAPTLTHILSYALVMLPLGWLLTIKLHQGLNGSVLAVILASLISAALLLGRFWMLDQAKGPSAASNGPSRPS
jgi:MATE family multidrug resistance protein